MWKGDGMRHTDNENKPKYEVPEVVTYTEEDILEELGPAQAIVYGGTGDSVMP
jgi:hypothetical protein